MIQVATAYSQSPSARTAAEAVSREALFKIGMVKVDAAIIFVSASFRKQLPEIVKIIRNMTQAKRIAGASGFGIITEDIEVERQRSLALMVISSQDLECHTFLESNLQENNFKAGQRLGESLRHTGMDIRSLLAFPDVYSFHSSAFFDGFEDQIGYVPILGGTAAEEGKEEKTYQIEGARVTFDAVSGIAFGSGLRQESAITKSCRPFGDSFQITRAEGNVIYEMDGRPAYDILLESLSGFHFKNSDQILQNVFLGIPLRSFQTEFKGPDYLIRNITGTNAKKGMLSCISPVCEGDFVTFALRDAESARQDMRLMLEDLRHRVEPDEVRFGFYFNSCTRGLSLYRHPDEDIRMIRSYFPHVPILGFFTYGELLPLDHVNLVHHHSGVLVLMKEISTENAS